VCWTAFATATCELARRAVVAVALTLLAAPAAGQVAERERPLSLADAVAEAAAGNPDLSIALARSHVAAADALGAGAFRWPQLQVEGGITRSTDPVFAFGARLRQGVFAAEDLALEALNDPGAVQDVSAILGVRWEALSPARWASLSAARRQAEAAGWLAVRARQATVLGARLLYYDAVRALARSDAALAAETAAGATLDRFTRRQERGLLTDADRLQAEAELAAARAARLDAERRAREARQALGVFLGWEAGILPLPTDTLAAPAEFAAADFDLARRADLRALDAALAARAADARGARLAFLPAIDAFGQRATRGSEALAFEDEDWTLGVSLRWTAFAGLSRLADRRRADEALRIARLERDHALRAARAQIDAADHAVEATAAGVAAALAARRAATAAAELLRRRFEEGLATPAELLAAEARRSGMQSGAIEALAAYQVARATAEFARSTSDSEDRP
jgi:outer membrane protein TolC